MDPDLFLIIWEGHVADFSDRFSRLGPLVHGLPGGEGESVLESNSSLRFIFHKLSIQGERVEKSDFKKSLELDRFDSRVRRFRVGSLVCLLLTIGLPRNVLLEYLNF